MVLPCIASALSLVSLPALLDSQLPHPYQAVAWPRPLHNLDQSTPACARLCPSWVSSVLHTSWSLKPCKCDECKCCGQMEGESLVSQPAYSRLHSALWKCQLQALQRCKPAAAQQAHKLWSQAAKSLQDLSDKPPHVAGCPLHPHQLQASALKLHLMHASCWCLALLATAHAQPGS